MILLMLVGEDRSHSIVKLQNKQTNLVCILLKSQARGQGSTSNPASHHNLIWIPDHFCKKGEDLGSRNYLNT